MNLIFVIKKYFTYVLNAAKQTSSILATWVLSFLSQKQSSQNDSGKTIYLIQNITDKPIILSDLNGIEISPRKVVDLEKIANKSDINNSRNLKDAISMKKLLIPKFIEINSDNTTKKATKKKEHKLDEEKIYSLIKKALSEQQIQQPNNNISETLEKAVAKSMTGLIDSIRSQINNVNVNDQPIPEISHEKLAEITQQSIQKITENIETNNGQKAKKINVVNKNIANLADEI